MKGGNGMKVLQILSRHAILAEDFYGNRKILVGNELGKQCKVNEIVPKEALDQSVSFEGDDFRNYCRLMKIVPESYFEIVYKIVSLAEKKLHQRLNPQILIILTDHIYFAVQRKKKNLLFYDENIWNVKKVYPSEFALAEEALQLIEKVLKESLPREEAACLVFHIVNAQQGTASMNVFETADIIKNILSIIKFFYGREADIASTQYARFISYFQLFLQRMGEGKTIASQDAFLHQQAKEKYRKEIKCIGRMETYLQKIFQRPVPSEEKIYLAVYLRRMMEEEE